MLRGGVRAQRPHGRTTSARSTRTTTSSVPPSSSTATSTLEGGCEWLLRSDGELINWYTTEEWIKWGGKAENYGKEHDEHWEATTQFLSGEERAHDGYNHAFPSVSGHEQHPIPSTMPVRSKTIGAWNGDGM